jgi:hypothetical protein
MRGENAGIGTARDPAPNNVWCPTWIYEQGPIPSALGRTLPLDFSPANGRNPCSPLIDRRHAKVWISMSQPPLTQPRSQPREQFHPKL